MSIRKLKPFVVSQGSRPIEWEVLPDVAQRFALLPRLEAGDGDDDNVVSIMGEIGESWFGESVTPKDIERRLRQIGGRDIVVNINSPGGNFFEGQAIFNLLALHPHQVTVRVMGMAASAASVIAMAGDRIEMPKASWMMIHNTWGIVMGDRNALRDIADDLQKFDGVTAALYAARSGQEVGAVAKMMDATTFMSGQEAVDKGFADAILDGVKVAKDESPSQRARRQVEAHLSRAGVTRQERRRLLQELSVKPGADGHGTPGAANDGTPRAPVAVSADAVRSLQASIDDLKNATKP